MGGSLRIPKGLKHSVWSVLDAAIYPAIYMAAMPVLMRGLGTKAFGFWVVLNSIIITLQLFNLNIGLTTVRNVSYCLAKNNLREVNKLINALFQISFLLLLAVVIVGIVIAYVIPEFDLLQLQHAPVESLTISLLLAAVIAGLKFFDLVFNNLLKAAEHFKSASILNTINRTGLLVVNVFLAVNGYSVLHLLWANVVYAIGYIVVQSFVVSKTFSFYRFSLRPAVSWYKRLLHFSVYPWLQYLIVVIAFQTDRFWVSAFAGLDEVSAYGLSATIFNHIHMIFMAMASWMLPRIAAMVAKGADPTEIYYAVRALLLGVATLCLLLFYLVYPFVFSAWVGKEIYQAMDVYIKAFIAFELVFTHTIMPFFYLNAAGREKLATMTTLLYACLSYLLMIAGLLIFNHTVYMIYGMTIAICITMPVINKLVKKEMNASSAFAPSPVIEMIPLYLSIVILYVPNRWISLLLWPVVLILLYRLYLSEVFMGKLWKQPAKL